MNTKKPTQLPKGKSQLEIKATLRHRDQVNDTVSVTFDAEPSPDALERYKGWTARILDSHATQLMQDGLTEHCLALAHAAEKVARLQALYDCLDPKGFIARKIEAILTTNNQPEP